MRFLLALLCKSCYTVCIANKELQMKTLCNKHALVHNSLTFTSFEYYNKVKAAAGDIVHYYANVRTVCGHMQRCIVQVQNGKVLAWQN